MSSRSLPHLARLQALPRAHKVLYCSNRRGDLLEELRETQERMTELMEQRKANLIVSLAQTNHMIRAKLERTCGSDWRTGPETRRRAREAVRAIEGGDATLGPGLLRLAPLSRKSTHGWRESTDSAGFAVGAGAGCIDGLKHAVSASMAAYGLRVATRDGGGRRAMGMEGAGSSTDRSQLVKVNRLPGIMQHPLKSSEQMEFREKAVRLGINLKRTGH
jgi:hypothetical protein